MSDYFNICIVHMNKQKFEVPGDIAHGIASITMDKKQVAKRVEQHILKNKMLWIKTHLKNYNWIDFYTIDPFCFSINHFPDETMNEFSLFLDCGDQENTAAYARDLLLKHFEHRWGAVNFVLGNVIDTLKTFGSKLIDITDPVTGRDGDVHDAMYKHEIHTSKQQIIINLNMKKLKKRDYFNTIVNFLFDYVNFTTLYSNTIKQQHLRHVAATKANLSDLLFRDQDN